MIVALYVFQHGFGFLAYFLCQRTSGMKPASARGIEKAWDLSFDHAMFAGVFHLRVRYGYCRKQGPGVWVPRIMIELGSDRLFQRFHPDT